jgi:type I restriction enzyme S subunit
MSNFPGFTKKSLGSLANARRGITYSAHMLVQRDEGLPYVNMKSFKKGGGFNKNGLKFFNGDFKKDDLANNKDLLIANTDVTLDGDIVGIPAYLPEYIRNDPVLFSHHVTRLRLTDEIDAHFLYYLLNTDECRRWMHKYARGTTVLMLDMQAINKIPIHFPTDISVRLKIVKILSTIDQTIEKTEELIEKYQQIKTGLMQDLFTRGIGSDGNLRPSREQASELYYETKIGWIPKDWQATKLKDILLRTGGYLQTGPFGSQLHAHEYTYEGVPVVMPQDIDNGLVHQDQIARITEHRANTLIKHRLKVGDIIIARRGELSRSAAITEFEKGWVCGTGCFLMRLSHTKLNSKFLSHAYRHSVIQRQVEGLAVGSTMPSLNNGIMGNLIFPDIGPREQTAISEKIQISEEKVTTLQAEKTKLKFLKSGLMHDLLTGKKTVSLDAAEARCV